MKSFARSCLPAHQFWGDTCIKPLLNKDKDIGRLARAALLHTAYMRPLPNAFLQCGLR